MVNQKKYQRRYVIFRLHIVIHYYYFIKENYQTRFNSTALLCHPEYFFSLTYFVFYQTDDSYNSIHMGEYI